MKMMSKLSLVALAMCAASTAVHAEDKSYGTASAKVTVNAMQEWKIEKVQDGSFTKLSDGTLGLNRNTQGAVYPEFKISNDSATASKYYIGGSGVSATEDGSIMVVNDDDTANKFKIVPAVKSSDTRFELDASRKKYVSPVELAANSSEEIWIAVTGNSSTNVIPGNYTLSLELFAPSV